jgi:Tol biopolymer transport system component
VSAFSVTYSPDRTSVAYISYPDLKLWRADADGRNARQLVSAPVEMKGAAWSPDNRWIAFAGRLDGEHMKIHLVAADGSSPPRPIVDADLEQGNPSWSPDGRQLCFGDVPTRFGVPDGGEVLHVYDVATRTDSPLPGSEGLWTCRWSPDGRYIAGLRIALGRQQMMLHLYDTRRRAWRALANAHHVNEPNWSSDSQFIYYDMEGQAFGLRRVRVSDGTVEELTSLPPYSFARHWSGLTPQDEPLLLRAAGSARLYGLKVDSR